MSGVGLLTKGVGLLTKICPFIVKSKITWTVLYRLEAFVVAQFIAPRTFIVVF